MKNVGRRIFPYPPCLEAADNNLEVARNLLQNRLAIIPLTRSEKEKRDKFKKRIETLASQLDMVYP